MCTTHPDKLAKAFKSRFHQYSITKPTVTDLSDRIAHICQNEAELTIPKRVYVYWLVN